jgi:hypothetical protein
LIYSSSPESSSPSSPAPCSSGAVSSGAVVATVAGVSTGSSEEVSCWGTWEPGVLTCKKTTSNKVEVKVEVSLV